MIYKNLMYFFILCFEGPVQFYNIKHEKTVSVSLPIRISISTIKQLFGVFMFYSSLSSTD